ncbi:MAG: diadenylate cyclase CdaA [Bacteroides sp.]|nr:diadenylate cyclase CdaA [Prevotella sp.]MCM1407346.1 diadenylate cyclase CdaA [Treponema brennaborense]MCM1469836.1 diadenylate cyclase CdaA [Bacteroides sp.]
MNFFDNVMYLYDYVRPVLDIGILTCILYKTYGVIVKTHGIQIIRAVILLAAAYAAALVLKLSTLLWLLNIMAPGLLIAFALVFQPELRKIFLKLGQGDWFHFGNGAKHTYIDSVLIAAEMLSNQRRGMLVVLLRHTALKDIIETGTRLNADLSSSLLVTIFAFDTPLHDGAVVIQDGKIAAAGCFLPLSEQYDIKKTFGTRHRAALGLSEETDAVVLVVSEETGAVSLAYDAKLYYDLTMEQLSNTLEKLLDLAPDSYTQEDDADEIRAEE